MSLSHVVREFETERAALVRKAEDDTRNSRFVNILFKTFHARFPVSGAARDIGLRPTISRPAADTEASRRTREKNLWHPG